MSRQFWTGMRKAASSVAGLPDYSAAGINLSERHFITYRHDRCARGERGECEAGARGETVNVITCPECGGTGEHAVYFGVGVFLAEEGELTMAPCRICKGQRVVVQRATTCADCDVDIIVTLPPNEPLGERVCHDCAGN